jgi:hypothetical protein
MFDSIGHLISEILHSFGSLPAELLNAENVFEGTNESLAARGVMAQQSPQARLIKVLPLFVTQRDTVLNSEVAVPLWLEMKLGTAPYETWSFVHWVNQPVLEESRLRGDRRCSFYREANTGFWHLLLSYDPLQVQHRLWHSADVKLVELTTDTLSPLFRKFAVMFKYDIQINVVPGIMMRSSVLPEERQLTAMQIGALNSVVAHAQQQLETKWNQMWELELRAGKEVRGRFRRRLVTHGYAPFVRRTY